MIELALAIVAGGAFLRGVVVVGAMLRTALNWKRFVRVKMGWAEWVTLLEPFLLLAWSWRFLGATTAPASAVAAWGGALMVSTGWALIVWTWLSWPAIYAGHAVL